MNLHRSSLPAEERQSHLIEASEDYMRGKITRNQFQEAECKYGTDYSAVTLELASENRLFLQPVKRWLSTLFKGDKTK